MGFPQPFWAKLGRGLGLIAVGEVLLYLFTPHLPQEKRIFLAVALCVMALISWVAGHFVEKFNRADQEKSIARADVSLAWQRQAGRRLEVNLAKPSLNGTRLGGDIHGLSFLGPAEENAGAPDGFLDYPSRGLELEMSEGRLIGFVAEVAPASGDEARAVIFGGRDGSKRLDRASTEADITAALGAPFWRDGRDRRVALYFERRDGEQWVEILLELDRDGRLELCSLTSTPALAEPYMRKRLGVTLGWPPERETGRGG